MGTTSKRGDKSRGRPPGCATRRISPRFPVGVVEKIEYAAALRGVSVSAFVQEAVADRADRVIEAETRWELTREEADRIAGLTANPPKPNRPMLDATKRAAAHVVVRD